MHNYRSSAWRSLRRKAAESVSAETGWLSREADESYRSGEVYEGHIDELDMGAEYWSCDYSAPYTISDGAPSDWNPYSGGGPGEGIGVEWGQVKLLTLTDPNGLQVRQETAPAEWAQAQNTLTKIFQMGEPDAQRAEQDIIDNLPGSDDY